MTWLLCVAPVVCFPRGSSGFCTEMAFGEIWARFKVSFGGDWPLPVPLVGQ